MVTFDPLDDGRPLVVGQPGEPHDEEHRAGEHVEPIRGLGVTWGVTGRGGRRFVPCFPVRSDTLPAASGAEGYRFDPCREYLLFASTPLPSPRPIEGIGEVIFGGCVAQLEANRLRARGTRAAFCNNALRPRGDSASSRFRA